MQCKQVINNYIILLFIIALEHSLHFFFILLEPTLLSLLLLYLNIKIWIFKHKPQKIFKNNKLPTLSSRSAILRLFWKIKFSLAVL